MTEEMTIISGEAYRTARELLDIAGLERGSILVVGCSTSEEPVSAVSPVRNWRRWYSAESTRLRRRWGSGWLHSAASI